MGNCLNDKNYLRWANRFPVPSSTALQKSDTIADAPDDVHLSRYKAMEEKQIKQQEPPKAVVNAAPSTSVSSHTTKVVPKSEKENRDVTVNDRTKISTKLLNCSESNENVKHTMKTCNGSETLESANSMLIDAKPDDTMNTTKDSTMSDIDLAKLERKRRQQQQKEELLRKLKRSKPDHNPRTTDHSLPGQNDDSSSPIPEGKLEQHQSSQYDIYSNILILLDNSESWMREVDPETFRVLRDVEWSDDESLLNQPPPPGASKVPHQPNATAAQHKLHHHKPPQQNYSKSTAYRK